MADLQFCTVSLNCRKEGGIWFYDRFATDRGRDGTEPPTDDGSGPADVDRSQILLAEEERATTDVNNVNPRRIIAIAISLVCPSVCAKEGGREG